MVTYQLKLTLQGTQPPVWRQVRIPANLTMESLHMLIQVLMEWEDCHLYKFQKDNISYVTDNGEEEINDVNVAIEGLAVENVLKQKGDALTYIYDFGDWWDITIVLEDIVTDYNVMVPQLIGGERPAPPEDCGGLPGYYQLLQILNDPKNPEYNEIREWVGEYYNADSFDKDFIEEELEDYLFDYIYDDEAAAGTLSMPKQVQLAAAKFWDDHHDTNGFVEAGNELVRDLSRGTRFMKHEYSVTEFAAAIITAIARVNLLCDVKHSVLPLTEDAIVAYFGVTKEALHVMIEQMEECVMIEPIYSPYLMPVVVEKNPDIRKEIEKSMGLD
ncbi:MAG: plasmid pRiA4b ORF-3 family protein [Marinifilaceae bacterium]